MDEKDPGKHDCYSCEFRGEVAGSAHSSCSFIRDSVLHNPDAGKVELLIAAGLQEILVDGKPSPIINEHGKRRGWAMWPINFDPVWIESCKFYKNKNNAST